MDILAKEEIERFLASPRVAGCPSTLRDGIKVVVLPKIDSTNLYARALIAGAECPTTPTAVIADCQTAGRGRMGRRFDSPSGCGLYLSLVYRPCVAASANSGAGAAKWTAGAAVAVCRAVSKLFAVECGIKWVNDIFLNGKKICGILAEGVSGIETGALETIIVGIGVNVRLPPAGFAPEIRDIAGAITSLAPPACPSRSQLAAELIFQLLNVYENENFFDILTEYKRRSIILGQKIFVFPLAEGPSYAAEALDIDQDANLIVRAADGEVMRLNSGEVKIIPAEINNPPQSGRVFKPHCE
ncbi:MAG: biotin--[acetyl-CoA-carboxylase] ligase [Treponemataceae bacterium]|nr:MAG: biotin--[acetyl-CoA-carboxylase] ligase [Treponemataceae bacterium]